VKDVNKDLIVELYMQDLEMIAEQEAMAEMYDGDH
jgi:hypothetical protein